MKELPKLDAVFFRTAHGREPVREWLKKELTREECRQVGEEIAYVQYKWPIGKPRVDHLHGDIWEVRSSFRNRIARVLFAVQDNTIVLLHGFIKKTRATDQDEIRQAEQRWKEWSQYHEK